jgi:hypothetical protein
MRRRHGIALLAALAVMTLVALLVVGALASSTLAQRSSRLSHTDALLTAAADFALNSVLADARGYGLADLPLGVSRAFVLPFPDDTGVHVDVAVTRLRAGALWLVADASLSGTDQGHRRANLVARFPMVGAPAGSGVVSRGAVSLGRNVAFPSDTASETDCGQPSAADLLLPLAVDVTGGGAAAARVAHSAAAADSATYYLTGRQITALAPAANVIHVRGDTTISGGTLDGILIVDGSLTIAGPFVAIGLVIARGRVDARAGGFVLTGALLSFAVPPAGVPAIDISDATVRYSGCAVEHVLRAAIPPRPVHQRSWAELF